MTPYDELRADMQKLSPAADKLPKKYDALAICAVAVMATLALVAWLG